MRIGMILDNSFPPDPRVENEAVSLIKAGHEVHLFSLSYADLPAEETINGIRVHRYQAGKLIYKLSALAYTVPFYHWLVSGKIEAFIKKVKPQALHVHDMLIAQAVFDVNKKYRLPLVLDLHENRPEIMAHYGHVKKLSGRLLINLKTWRKKQLEFMQQADRLVLITEEGKATAADEADIQPAKIAVVPNVITPEIFYQYPINKELIERFSGKFNLLYLGDTGLRRGTDTAIEAVKLLKPVIPNINLILVGKSKEDVYLKDLVKVLEVEENVTFEGYVSMSLFPSYALASQVCLSPLKRNIHHDTTFANKLFQYMAMARPVVVSDCTAQANVVLAENCGLVHKAENVENLADKILQLYNHPELREQMGQNGKAAVDRQYNWTSASQELIRLYEELLLIKN